MNKNKIKNFFYVLKLGTLYHNLIYFVPIMFIFRSLETDLKKRMNKEAAKTKGGKAVRCYKNKIRIFPIKQYFFFFLNLFKDKCSPCIVYSPVIRLQRQLASLRRRKISPSRDQDQNIQKMMMKNICKFFFTC